MNEILINLTDSSNYFMKGYTACYGYKKTIPESLKDSYCNIKFIPIETVKVCQNEIENRTDGYFNNARKRIRKLENNRSKYDINMLFWLIDHRDLYYNIYEKFTVFEKLRSIFRNHQLCKFHIILKESQLIIKDFIQTDNDLISCTLKISIEKERLIKNRIENIILFQYIYNIIFTFCILLFILIKKTIYYISSSNRNSDKNIILSITSPDTWDPDKGTDKNQNIIHTTLAKNNQEYLYIDYITHNGIYFKNLISKLKNGNFLPLEYYFPMRKLFTYFYNSISIFKGFRTIRNLIEESFADKNNKANTLDFKTGLIFDSASPFLASYELCIKELLIHHKVKLVFFQPEAGLFGRWFGPMFTSKGIPFIGVQHGLIRENNVTYKHLKTHINPEDYKNSEKNPNYCPLPTCTLVWSDYVKDLLVEKYHYPPEAIYVTGNPQYSKNKEKKETDYDEIRKNIDLPTDKKIVLLTVRTSGMGHTAEYDNKVLELVYKLPQLNYNYFILCKLHGLESEKMHSDVYRQLKLNKEQALITRDIDIMTAITISDIVISVRSTTIFEAMSLGRPVMIINPENMDQDALDIGKSGGVFYATNTEELIKQLDIISTNNVSDNMKEIQGRLVGEKLGDISLDPDKLIENFIQNIIPTYQP